jgi:large subunit ribosomal protein L4
MLFCKNKLMELPVFRYDGEDSGRKVNLPDSIFNVELNPHVVYLDIKNIRANKRQGTHSSKERPFVTGSTRKIKKQKGTGTARAGSITSSIFRGGARAFGPRPRNYGGKVNKKVKDLACKSALTYKARSGNVIILEDFNFDTPKTKAYLQVLVSLGVFDVKTLLLLGSSNKNVFLSSRNLKCSEVSVVDFLNAYDVTNSSKLLLTEEALEKIVKRLI